MSESRFPVAAPLWNGLRNYFGSDRGAMIASGGGIAASAWVWLCEHLALFDAAAVRIQKWGAALLIILSILLSLRRVWHHYIGGFFMARRRAKTLPKV